MTAGAVSTRASPRGPASSTFPSAGTYNILANSYAPNVTGGYTLSLTSSQPGCSYTLGAAEQSFGPSGGTGSLCGAAGAGCGWGGWRKARAVAAPSPTPGS